MASRIHVDISFSPMQLKKLDLIMLDTGATRSEIISYMFNEGFKKWEYTKDGFVIPKLEDDYPDNSKDNEYLESVNGIPFLDPYYEYDDEFYDSLDK